MALAADMNRKVCGMFFLLCTHRVLCRAFPGTAARTRNHSAVRASSAAASEKESASGQDATSHLTSSITFCSTYGRAIRSRAHHPYKV